MRPWRAVKPTWMSSRTVNTPSQGAGDGIIAFLQVHDGDLPSASELVEGCRHGRIRVAAGAAGSEQKAASNGCQ